MAAQHDHFVGFISAANLCDRVVRSRALGIDAIDDIEFEHNLGAVVQNASDAPEVFIAHHHCRNHFVNVKRLVVESTNLAKLTTRIVNPH